MTKEKTPQAPLPGRHAFIAIFFVVLIDIIGFGIIIPVLPKMIQSVTGLSLAQAAPYGSYLLVVFALVQFFSSPIIGGLSDRFGRRPVLLFSLVGYAVDFAIMGLAKTFSILFVGRIFSAIFAATYSTSNAYIADITPQERRAERFAMLGAAFGLGFIIGPGIGGTISDNFGYRAPFFVASGLAALNFVYCWFVLPETLTPEKRRAFDWRRANPLGNLLQIRQYPVMIPLFIAIFLVQIAYFSVQSTWAWYTPLKLSWSDSEVGYSLMAVGLGAAIVQGVLIRFIIPAIGERAALIAGGVLSICEYIGFAFATSTLMIYVFIAIGAFTALMQPAANAIMSRTIPENAQGELQGALSSILSISMIIGPYIMLSIFSVFSSDQAPIYFPGAPFLLGAILTVLAGIPMLIAFSKDTPETAKRT